MYCDQREALQTAERHIEQLVVLLRGKGLEEDDALAIVRGIPNIEELAASTAIDELYPSLFEAKSNVSRRPRKIPFDQDDPTDRTYPGHRDFMPNVTTKEVFNEHMAQAATPYVLAIANKIAEERGLAKPDERIIKQVMKKVDWTRAAYEMKGMQPKPSRSKAIKFLDKWIFDPIDDAFDKLYIKRLWPVVTAVQVPLLMYAALTGHMEKLARPARAAARVSARRLAQAGEYKLLRTLRSPLKRSWMIRNLRRAAKWV